METKSPKISVVMPVYNTKEEYLREAIESILNQTYSDFEFIILNDGSTNNAEEVILSYKDERIKYYKNEENLGLSATRNKLLDLAKGEYIAYMDSDDISLPERFEKQVNYMENHKDVDILGSSLKLIPQDEIYAYPSRPMYFDMLLGCCMANNSIMMRKDKIQQYNLEYSLDFPIAEDYEFWTRAIRSLNFTNIEDILVKYRRHDENITKTKKEFLQSCDRKIRQNMLNFLTDDEKLKDMILRYLSNEKAPTFIEKIFSIRKSRSNEYKIVTILGFRFLVKIKQTMLRNSATTPGANKNAVKLVGGLGNQMFQYAFLRAYSAKNSADMLIDVSSYKKNNKSLIVSPRNYDLEHFNIDKSISTKKDSDKIKTKVKERNACVFDKKLLTPKKNVLFVGYFQSEKYFKKYRSIILNDFTLKEPLNIKNINMLEKIKNVNSVSIHIRRGDYVKLKHVHGLCDMEYYKKAIEYIAKIVDYPHFFLFSDDIGWVRENFKIDYPYTIVDINSDDENYFDLELMKNCKHNIIANSTFSWWGAWLNDNPNKIVIAPKRWFADKDLKYDDIVCEDWIKI